MHEQVTVVGQEVSKHGPVSRAVTRVASIKAHAGGHPQRLVCTQEKSLLNANAHLGGVGADTIRGAPKGSGRREGKPREHVAPGAPVVVCGA